MNPVINKPEPKVQWRQTPQTEGFTDAQQLKFYASRKAIIHAIQKSDQARKLELRNAAMLDSLDVPLSPKLEYTESEIDDMALEAMNSNGVYILVDGKLTLTQAPVAQEKS